MKEFQIITDSASDLKSNYIVDENIGFKVVPLTITVGNENFIDDDDINVDEMLKAMHASKTKTSTACPSPDSFSKNYQDAKHTFVVTISSKLSGTYNSALLGANELANTEYKIHVIDSKLVAGTQMLIVDKLYELIKSGLSFEEIVIQIDAYRDERNLYFTLNKFDNLVENGRMSKFAALIAKTLIIRPICKGVNGEIKVIDKMFGVVNTLKKIVQHIKKSIVDFKDKIIVITKCKADEEVNHFIKFLSDANCDFKEVRVQETKGLCSFYALEKGIIISY